MSKDLSSIALQSNGGFSKDDIDMMKKNAEQYAYDDKLKIELLTQSMIKL